MARVRLAVLGAGNMGSALIAGAIRGGIIDKDINFTSLDSEAAWRLVEGLGVIPVATNPQAVTDADLVIVAVKPKDVASVLAEITPVISGNTVVISVAVGIDLATLAANLPAGQPIIRAMPNTPSVVGKGVIALSANEFVTAGQLALAESVFKGSGIVVVVPENEQAAIGAISGSGPAFVAYFLEALIEAGVHQGLSRALATELAVATVAGTAEMIGETGEHPAVAREKVTSPGGT
ncbi:MAG: pyrroline-5-carboxylate reductase, partial [Promicromonosporaceae bacterium]|nr:pyrroline-5-carboxylate reductase [Promicromonosporaceae bacterium]